MPWEVGPRQELVELVSFGRWRPGRVVDLGLRNRRQCGLPGPARLRGHRHRLRPGGPGQATAKATTAGVQVRFLEDDLTRLRRRLGTFDLLVDYSTLDDLSPVNRSRYVDNVLPLARPGARFLLWCFQWPSRRLDRWMGLVSVARSRLSTPQDIVWGAAPKARQLRDAAAVLNALGVARAVQPAGRGHQHWIPEGAGNPPSAWDARAPGTPVGLDDLDAWASAGLLAAYLGEHEPGTLGQATGDHVSVSTPAWARAALSHPCFTGLSRQHLGGVIAEVAGLWGTGPPQLKPNPPFR